MKVKSEGKGKGKDLCCVLSNIIINYIQNITIQNIKQTPKF
jgi:hypothetical protein